MNYAEYRDFRASVAGRNIIFYYFGYFSQHIVSAMADAVRLQLEQAETAAATRRKIFSSFVEMAQNITHYSVDALTPEALRDNQLRQGSVCIGIEDGRYFLLSANPVAPESVDALRSKLEPLRTMTLEDIKRAYRETLRAEQPEGSKGAGLGFLTVARDASAPLEFEFGPCEGSDAVMFYVKATI
ncbi:MAG TPA: SiaB family protein kinase [Rhodanobacteraceae bacterium]|nr:SiaB family protein kinase [Rhodanobacteraceae bacterium]